MLRMLRQNRKVLIMDREIQKRAWKKVKRIKRFYLHAGFTAIMGVFFFALNMVTDPFDMWFIFPMIPLTALVGIHYLFVFGFPGFNFMSREWEEREYERQLDKLEDHPPYRSERYLPYTELTPEETLELRRIQMEGDKYFKEEGV